MGGFSEGMPEERAMTWTSRSIVLFSGLACCLAGCSRSSSDYYRFVSYDARMDVVGRAEVSEADAPRRIEAGAD